MYSPISIDNSVIFGQIFLSNADVLGKSVTVTGTLVIQNGEFQSLSQNQKLSYINQSIGNFGTQPFSVRIICKIGSFVSQSSGTINTIISKGTAETNGFTIDLKSDNKLYAYTVATGGKIYDTAINDSKYHDIIITRSGTSLIGYVDGVQRLTVSCSSATVNTGSLQISGDSTTAKCSILNVKLIELYNKALSADEVLALYNNDKFSIYNSVMNIKNWFTGTGVYIEDYITTNSNNIIKKGQKYFNCTNAGNISYAVKQAYGTWEFSFNCNENDLYFPFISNVNTSFTNFNGYYFVPKNSGTINLLKRTGASGSYLLSTANSYISFNTWYRIRITRSLTGVFTLYIIGGTFSIWTLVSTTGGSGSNPVTDNTYTISNFFNVEILGATGLLISDIRFYTYIINY